MMARTADTEIFMRNLPEDGTPIGNGHLKAMLGWEEERYERAKAALLEAGDIVKGRGQGGSIMRSRATRPKLVRVFISYSHIDDHHQKLLSKHLQPLVREGKIEIWTDGVIQPGEEWAKAIEVGLTEADLILLLISIDFINSDYCYEKEMKKAVERHERDEAKVIPIIVRPCQWNMAPFAKLQALPKSPQSNNLLPIELWNHNEDAYDRIASAIRQIVEDMLANRSRRKA
jgi:hypothetical protein